MFAHTYITFHGLGQALLQSWSDFLKQYKMPTKRLIVKHSLFIVESPLCTGLSYEELAGFKQGQRIDDWDGGTFIFLVP
jgi:hypothetical protein